MQKNCLDKKLKPNKLGKSILILYAQVKQHRQRYQLKQVRQKREWAQPKHVKARELDNKRAPSYVLHKEECREEQQPNSELGLRLNVNANIVDYENDQRIMLMLENTVLAT